MNELPMEGAALASEAPGAFLARQAQEEARGQAQEEAHGQAQGQASGAEAAGEFSWDAPGRPGKRSSFVTFADERGTPIRLPVLEIAGEREGARLLVFAAIHGDEYEGVETIYRLYDALDPGRLSGRLVMVPVANPFAYRGRTRCSPEDGVNLARVFPGKADGSATERLAYALHHRLLKGADFLLDLHSGGTHYAVATLAGYYDNPATDFGRRCRAAAEAFGAPLLWGHESIAAGRSVSSAQALGLPWLYTEAYGGGRIREEDRRLFYDGTLRLMAHLGMLAGSSPSAIAAETGAVRTVYGDGNFDASVVSGTDGFFVPHVPLTAEVRKGELIGSIYTPDGTKAEEICAHADGLLVMTVGTPVVRCGEPLYMLAALRAQRQG